jgi:hypothetical protein
MASVHTPKNIKDLSLDEQDYLVEWVQGEQDGDRNWQSEIEEIVYTLEDAITWLTDNEYDWKNMVAKDRLWRYYKRNYTDVRCSYCGVWVSVEGWSKKHQFHGMPTSIRKKQGTIEQAHIDSDIHAQTCDDENCDECNPSA